MSWKDKVKVTNSKKITRDTPSEVDWYDVQIRNGSDKYCGRYRADTVLSTDRRTDGRTDRRTDGRTTWNQYTPPPPLFNFIEAGGIIMILLSFPSRWYNVSFLGIGVSWVYRLLFDKMAWRGNEISNHLEIFTKTNIELITSYEWKLIIQDTVYLLCVKIKVVFNFYQKLTLQFSIVFCETI